jgi:hypothetical protein
MVTQEEIKEACGKTTGKEPGDERGQDSTQALRGCEYRPEPLLQAPHNHRQQHVGQIPAGNYAGIFHRRSCEFVRLVSADTRHRTR